MKPHVLTIEQEQEISRRLELRKAWSDKNLMAEFGCSRSVLYRIASEGPRDVPRETKQKVSIDELMGELRGRGIA